MCTSKRWLYRVFSGLSLLAILAFAAPGSASAEAADCLSPDPSQWPEPAKPYFLVLADTSGSMATPVGLANPCGYPDTRVGHLTCALNKAFQSHGGPALFGLMTFAAHQAFCQASCYTGCTVAPLPGDADYSGCGPEPTLQPNSAARAGGNLVVPLNPQANSPSNVASLLSWVDFNCSNSTELFAAGSTPLNGVLRDAFRYFSSSWTSPVTSATYMTPLLSSGELACRSLNVILISDGTDTCDEAADAVDAAADLYSGFDFGGIHWNVRVYVINAFSGMETAANSIAAAGGTGTAYVASDATGMIAALNAIIASKAGAGESCDNADNNCNGCTDEGFAHYCHTGSTCCAWSTSGQRATCFNNYMASITLANPKGNTTLLPCTSIVQGATPATWLCFDPAEVCDNTDNNCNGSVDEGMIKCGSPLHCPTTEVCDGQDNDCDGVIDESGCSGCVPTVEVCDGCDNDCDGQADEGIAPIPCGLSSPSNCVGTRPCKPAQTVLPGGCVSGGGWGTCSNTPQTEVCDGIDNDCDSLADDSIPPFPCVPAGTPSNLNYGPNSQCKKGNLACGTSACLGFAGPSAEVCDGIDNDCDGTVDDSVFGVGALCGINQLPCTPGHVACVNGALVCQGGTGPQPEVCDGVDNDCDATIDDLPLADAPPAGQNGCWDQPGNCCMFDNATWCPPPGASCNSLGSLASPCLAGKLVCMGVAGFQCAQAKSPGPEQCNGRDDDCNGTPDDGPLPGVGGVCSKNVGACKEGHYVCLQGRLKCDGTMPQPELCDLQDNDCDDETDEELPLGTECTMFYDIQAFPGERTSGVCRMGVLACDQGMVCRNGVAPSAELCDGLDNDCDGQTDEAEPGPEGVLGSKATDSEAILGQPCGNGLGACQNAVWTCQQAQAVCDLAPAIERCDGIDNDCDGAVDESPMEGEEPLCAAGSLCVRHQQLVRCSQPCAMGTLPLCPGSQDCVAVVASTDDSALPDGCLPRELLTLPLALPQGDLRPLREAPAMEQPQPDSESAEMPLEVAEAPLPHADEASETAGCTAAEAGSTSVVWLAALALLALCALRRMRRIGVLLPLILAVAITGSACSGGTDSVADVGTEDGVTDDAGTDAQHDGILPDSIPDDAQKPDTHADVADAELADTDVADAADVDAGDTGDVDAADADVSQCPEADLHDPQTCGACDHNCLDEVPPNSDAQTVVCDWSGNPEEAGECLFAGCITGWVNVDPFAPGCEYQCTTTQVAEDTCNQVDDDCDSDVDEDVDLCSVDHCGTCGTVCTGDNATFVCDSGRAACSEAVCAIQTCSDNYHDIDLDWKTGCEYPCAATSEFEEVCDGLDDNCNGQTDETFVYSSPLTCGTCENNCYEALPNADIPSVQCAWSGVADEAGVCSFTQCARNYWDLDAGQPGCEYYCVMNSLDESLCNQYDDDCDGVVDEDVDFCSTEFCGSCGHRCVPGYQVTAVECASLDASACATEAHCAITTCAEGFLDLDQQFDSGCEYACTPTGAESCNGLDDDCNGLVDDQVQDAGVGTVCFTSPLGECASPSYAGVVVCMDGALVCSGSNLLYVGQLPEICNNQDDDCNGIIDDFPMDVGMSCGESNIYPCSKGTIQCVSGTPTCIGAKDPVPETCNGLDDDCDGQIDMTEGVQPADSVGACNVPVPPPSGAIGHCEAGTKSCVGGTVQCVESVTPVAGGVDSCGEDTNCDGLLTNQPDKQTDVHNCGVCGYDCYTGAVNSRMACTYGVCTFDGCEPGYYDFNNDSKCETPCTFTSAQESCNNLDDNCNGLTDENLTVPLPSAVCGVSTAATGPECTSLVQVQCVQGAWACTFILGNCSPTCAAATEICDAMDNNCNGVVNENVVGYGMPCYSDDGMPAPGHGACRTSGTRVCDGLNQVVCSAQKADCSSLGGGCTELCDGVDNDCDGSVDEAFNAKGNNSTYFVKPAVTKIASSLWMFSYEASRNNATTVVPGSGNGYFTSAPVGVTLDKTRACSVPSKTPWYSATGIEGDQVCTALGGHLCTVAEWQLACRSGGACNWAYNPAGVACLTTYSSSKYCNLAPSYDFTPGEAGDQDGLLATASTTLQNCWADWSGQFGNTAATSKIFDMTGNLAELAYSAVGVYAVMGGSYQTAAVEGAQCSNSSFTVGNTFSNATTGFRCCFAADPTL